VPPVEEELGDWRVWDGRRLVASRLPRHEAQQLVDRIAGDGHPEVHAEDATSGEELAPTPPTPTWRT
jgi:hypothetical protein